MRFIQLAIVIVSLLALCRSGTFVEANVVFHSPPQFTNRTYHAPEWTCTNAPKIPVTGTRSDALVGAPLNFRSNNEKISFQGLSNAPRFLCICVDLPYRL
jgi:hypothetical protein